MKLFSFPYPARLHKPIDFKRLFSSSTRLTSKYWVFIAATTDLHYARLGIVVPKKNLAKAVARNQTKRLVRESFRYRQQDLAGVDVVVLASRNLQTLNHVQIRTSLDEQWARLIKRLRGYETNR